MATKKPKVGDVFELPLSTGEKMYVQYIGNDATDLGSYVIRVFKKKYSLQESPAIEYVVKDKPIHYIHLMDFKDSKITLKTVGHSLNIGEITDAKFRSADIWGNLTWDTTYNWHIWTMNEPSVRVAHDYQKYSNYEIGIVCWPDDIEPWVDKGHYPFTYPQLPQN